jgi:hypothetical protein
VSNVISLEQVLAAVRHRWGHHSIVRPDGGPAAAVALAHRDSDPAGAPKRWPRRLRELPPWWPVAFPNGAVRRPRSLEVVGAAGSGRLALALAWLAAARPALVAVVDCAGRAGAGGPTGNAGGAGRRDGPNATAAGADAAWFYPPAAAGAGLPLERLIVVRPPPDESRAALEAATVLLRSEAFDVVVCPLPPHVRIGSTYGGKLAALAARSGTTLLLLTTPPSGVGAARSPGALAAFAEYRVRLAQRRWLWRDGELAGMRLRVATERARHAAAWAPGAGNDVRGADDAPPEHQLTLRLHRSAGHGPFAPDGSADVAGAPAAWLAPGAPAGAAGLAGAVDRGAAPFWTPDRFYLENVARVVAEPVDTSRPISERAVATR